MSDRSDDRLDALLASVSPVSEAEVADLPISRSERDLLAGIIAEAEAVPLPVPVDLADLVGPIGGERPPEPPLPLEPAARRVQRGRRRQLIGLIGSAAVVAVVVAAFASREPRSDPSVRADDPSARAGEPPVEADGPPAGADGPPAGADEPPVGADDAAPGSWPQLVLELPDWYMERMETASETEGSMSFIDSRSGGMRGLLVDWAPASEREPGGQDDEVLSTRQVTGVEAVVSRSRTVAEQQLYGDRDRFEATWLLDGFSLTAAGMYTTEDEFVQVLSALRKVELDAWLDALPPTVIWPGDQAVIDAMLTDVPLPPGFDPSQLVEEQVRSRDVVRGQVAQAVACGWVESWIAATDAGDAAGVRQAVDAMAGSGDWAIVQEPDPEADQLDGQLRQLQFDEIRMIAEAMPTDALIPLDGGPGMRVRELYANWLDCHP